MRKARSADVHIDPRRCKLRAMLVNLSDLDVRLIRVFLAVVDSGGITRAQSALKVGQSTLSTQLGTLEVRLGYRLCERGRGGFRLTAKGERFERAARQLVSTMNEFCHQAQSIDTRLVGVLKIGIIDHTPPTQHALFSQAIARFRERDESVQFSILLRTPEQIVREILSGDLHIGLGYFWHRVPSLEYARMFIEEQRAYCGRGHPLFSQKRAIDVAEACSHEWVGRTYPVAELDMRAKCGRVAALADNMEAVVLLLMSGGYCGYLPPAVAQPYVELGLLRVLNSRELRYEVPIHIVSQRPDRRGEIVEAFLEDLWMTQRENEEQEHRRARAEPRARKSA
jgi:LysR family transcriptional regulator, transcriptional activator for bauABCD operon